MLIPESNVLYIGSSLNPVSSLHNNYLKKFEDTITAEEGRNFSECVKANTLALEHSSLFTAPSWETNVKKVNMDLISVYVDLHL